MKTKLFKNKSEDEVKELKQNFLHALPTRKALIKVLEEEVESAVSEMTQGKPNTTNNWTLTQVALVENIRAYRKLITLLEG